MVERKAMTYGRLSIEQLQLWLHLGCTEEERRVAQEVHLKVQIQFPEMPPGCESDQLKDTHCYASLAETLVSALESRSFQLIERVGAFSYELLKPRFHTGERLHVCVHKLRPPIERITGGTRFCYGDFPCE